LAALRAPLVHPPWSAPDAGRPWLVPEPRSGASEQSLYPAEPMLDAPHLALADLAYALPAPTVNCRYSPASWLACSLQGGIALSCSVGCCGRTDQIRRPRRCHHLSRRRRELRKAD
jgi:hypothetical protein